MSKILVDRELLERVVALLEWDGMDDTTPLEFGAKCDSLCKELSDYIAQPAEAEGVADLEPILEAVAREYGMGGLSDGLYADYACDVAKRYASAALSSVTAERDRLESMLIQTTARHFAQEWKDHADDKKLDECLSEGIAMLEAERDQLRAEVEGMRAQRDKMAQILRDLVPGCKWRFMRPRIDQALQEVDGGN
ncbi:hypothetical protein EGI99_08515 [Stutzerimonas stutzeri]|nr:hypothetical protein EGI99_08515 [Stutzerimonas stutzeri]